MRRAGRRRHDIAGEKDLARCSSSRAATPFAGRALGGAFLDAARKYRCAPALDHEDVRPRVVALEATRRVTVCESVREVRPTSDLRGARRARRQGIAKLFEPRGMDHLRGRHWTT